MEQIISSRKFGIEIEAYNVNRSDLARELNRVGIECHSEHYNHDARPHWKIVEDSSVRGVNAFELVSPPMAGQDGIEQIKKVCQVLNNLNAKVNKSCGLHVHHNARQIKPQQVRNLVTLYKRSEDTIDSFMPESRRASNNHYCQSLKNVTSESYFAGDGSRYYKLNLASFHRHGTVEFRQHSGTVDAEKIINWVIFTQRMVDHACSSKFRVAHISKGMAWGILRVTLGFSRQIKKNMAEAIEINAYFENRIRQFA